MDVSPTALDGCIIISPSVFGDDRGLFQEVYNQRRYEDLGIGDAFVQDNYSRSTQGTLRGLHYQVDCVQGKLVQVLRGEVFDVCVDLRPGSPSFGKSASVILSESNHKQFYIPPGFAHGFYVLSESADFFYKCTELYAPEFERTLLWNDPALNIDWPLVGEPILSDKDKQGKTLDELELPRL